jgi:hypothetical protein
MGISENSKFIVPLDNIYFPRLRLEKQLLLYIYNICVIQYRTYSSFISYTLTIFIIINHQYHHHSNIFFVITTIILVIFTFLLHVPDLSSFSQHSFVTSVCVLLCIMSNIKSIC